MNFFVSSGLLPVPFSKIIHQCSNPSDATRWLDQTKEISFPSHLPGYLTINSGDLTLIIWDPNQVFSIQTHYIDHIIWSLQL